MTVPNTIAGFSGSRRRHRMTLAAVVAAIVLGACGEDFQGGAACPALCPEQNVTVFDTVLEPVVLDTSVGPFPTIGTEEVLLLARLGDTLDTRPVVRFDSLITVYAGAPPDTEVTVIDSPYVKLRFDKSRTRVTAPVTIDVFDVDTIVGDSATAANDTVTSRERLLFRNDRLLGSVTLDTNEIGDSARVPLDSTKLIGKIRNNQRLRLGFRATSSASVELYIVAREGGDAPVVRYDPSPDTAIKHVTVLPRSMVPRSEPVLSSDLTDYVHVLSTPAAPTGPVLQVGGFPARRGFLRFVIPSRILDSSNVLRATLLLTQAPAGGVRPDSVFTIFPLLVTAGVEITDPARSAFLTNPARVGFDSIRVAPSDSGLVEVEVVNALRAWGLPVADNTQRAVVLASGRESLGGAQALFFSTDAPPGLRPRLRVSYSPVRTFGIP
jgi:hypothetical protein